MEKYVFKKYSPKYRNYYLYEKKKILNTLGPKLNIQHVGSTSVIGLGGKGIVDIALGVNKSEINKYKNKLKISGYEFRKKASTPERLFFRKDYHSVRGPRRIHLHLVVLNGNEWKNLIKFRDFLKKDKKLSSEYGDIKKKAVKTARGNGAIYKKIKNDFIKNLLK